MSFPSDFVSYSSVIALLAFCFLVYVERFSGGRGRRHPPGPTRLPLIGNIHQLPAEYTAHEMFALWASRYGDLIYAKMFQTSMLIVNTPEIAQDLMVKRGSVYSGRIESTLVNDLFGWGSALPFITYGDRVRRQRKWMHEAFQTKQSLMNFRTLQRRQADLLVANFSNTPHAFLNHIRRFASALVLEPTYGRTVTSMNEEYVQLAEKTIASLVSAAGLPGTVLVDFFPIFKYVPTWMPGAGFRRHAAAGKVLVRQLLDAPYDFVVTNMASGTASPSFLGSLIEALSVEGLKAEDEEDIKGAASVVYGAGQVTTYSVLTMFVMAMVLYPEVQAKAQQEIRRVVGSERLPDFEDRESLPYIECILKEVYRWCCPVPLGIPHLATADDEYRGYYVAKGTVVIPNIWAMTRDENAFPEPETFRPERFEKMSTYTAELSDPRNLIFGFGRRICPGQQFADANIWLALATILATLEIGKARDADGNEVTPQPIFSAGFERHLKPFVCDIRTRSD